MKKVIGWIIFAVGALFAFACFTFAFLGFIGLLTSEGKTGVWVVDLFIAVLCITFCFLARYGWRLSHMASSETIALMELTRRRQDLAERIVQVIETRNDKVLFFTYKRLVVAHVGGLSWAGMGGGSGGGSFVIDAINMLMGLIDLVRSRVVTRKIKQLSKLSPLEILVANNQNFAIPYSEIVKVELLRRWLRWRIRVTTIRTIEYRLSKTRRVKTYINSLRPVLQDKLVF